MQKVRFLFYKPKLGDGHIVDNAIDIWTALWNYQVWDKQVLRCSHAEVWEPYRGCFTVLEYSNRYGEIEDWMVGKKYIGRCITSTMGQTGGKNRTGDGVAVRPACSILDQHPNRWYYYEYEVPINLAYRASLWAANWVMRNPGYGKAEIASFFLPFRIDSACFICSEFVDDYAAKCSLKIGRGDVPSPIRLSLRIHKSGKIPYDLSTGISLWELEDECNNAKRDYRSLQSVPA